VSKILSQDEIDALLESSTTVAPAPGAAPRGPNGQVVAAYNFRRPDRISKEQLRSLHFLHDRFAHNVSTSLSAFLRSVTEVTIVSVEQFAYSEFLMSLPEQTAFYAVSLDPLDGVAAVELNPSVAFTLVDRRL
jgi:flagellar motor switch protein FliM